MNNADTKEKSKNFFSLLNILIAGGVITAITAFVLPKVWPDNKPPEAKIITNTTSGGSPLTVMFDGLKSSDPEGKPLTFTWLINGLVVSNDPNFSRKFPEPDMKHAVSLTVKDVGGLEDSDSVIISVDPNDKSEIIIPNQENHSKKDYLSNESTSIEKKSKYISDYVFDGKIKIQIEEFHIKENGDKDKESKIYFKIESKNAGVFAQNLPTRDNPMKGVNDFSKIELPDSILEITNISKDSWPINITIEAIDKDSMFRNDEKVGIFKIVLNKDDLSDIPVINSSEINWKGDKIEKNSSLKIKLLKV